MSCHSVSLQGVSQPKYPEVAAFLRTVAANLETLGPTATFRRLVEVGALPWDESDNFKRWWRGAHRPSFGETIAMLEAASMLLQWKPGQTRYLLLPKLQELVRLQDEVSPEARQQTAEDLRAMAAALTALADDVEKPVERGSQP